MAFYLDTSVVIAAHCLETQSESVLNWLGKHDSKDFVSSTWLLTEINSALSIKQRRGELNDAEHQLIGTEISNFLKLIPTLHSPIESDFLTAANFCGKSSSRLRTGDSLHLAIALRLDLQYMVTLDDVLMENAMSLGMRNGFQ